MDHTLPEDAWKDSFDRLLDPIPYVELYFNNTLLLLMNKYNIYSENYEN